MLRKILFMNIAIFSGKKGKKPGKGTLAAMQEALKKVQEEQERAKKEEEERIRKEEEAERER